MSKNKINEIVGKIFEPLQGIDGLELVDIEYVKEGANYYLRVFIDKPKGITLEDCTLVNEELSQGLDREDPIPESYILEVSSPGLERPLKKEKDYIRFTGREIKIKTFVPLEGQKVFTGILKGFKDEIVSLQNEKGEIKEIPLEKVAKANLMVVF
ncbi:ribosome maturation factor RimP [Candidatus Contubernalis alkaliaceticus]|uniref:ribosome maturation factor RimP n=1 Tax=Candidatus Contubernalis alkaliaceticus TaxID=338645 RepID=UPI001F4C3082|nr:ribosome maturation factor RimP [Candidatus Contubernalis alkalaceticus]UNC91833.1 ribosome maturation factor RimP [Candidatus Contubernalis alkalaceticus]